MAANHESRIVEMVQNTIAIPVFRVTQNKIDYCNQAFIDLFRLSNISRTTPCIDEIFTQQGLFLELAAQCHERRQMEVVVQCSTSEGRVFWALLSLAKSEDQDGIYYSGTIQDQTDIIERERLLRDRNDELKKINSQLDRFMYSASHDIRQPVASIMGLIHLMQVEGASSNVEEYLVKMQTSVIKLDQFLTKIMQFSKNSHEHIESEQIDFVSMVQAKLDSNQDFIREKGLAISVEISDGFVFFSDRERLSVAVHHLLKNCFDFYDPSKTDPYVKVLVTTYADKAIVEVIDNGIGIPKNHVEKVTTMFYRASDRSKGSGLGLYIVNEIVLKLKGTLVIDSELGLGTMVRIEIPNGIKGLLVNRKRALLPSQ